MLPIQGGVILRTKMHHPSQSIGIKYFQKMVEKYMNACEKFC